MDATPQPPQGSENGEENNDWLLSPSVPSAEEPAEEPADELAFGLPTEAAPVAAETPLYKNRKVLTGAGFVAAGLVAGLLGGFALGGHGNNNTTAFTPTGNQQPGLTGQLPGGQQGLGGQGQGSQGQNGQGFGGFGIPGGGGGIAGELRMAGVLTKVGSSSITMKSVAGTTATYTVNGTTQILRNMQQASLSDLKVGDAVFVHVIPGSGSHSVAERIFAGTLPQGLLDRFGGGQGGPTTTQPGVITG